MKKFLVALLVVVFGLVLVNPASALTLAWDSYTDPDATGLRIYSSTDNTNWSTSVDNIATDKVASDIPDGSDYTRIWYKIVAFNANGDSVPSNVVSFYWTFGGGGNEGLAPMNDIRLLDCDQILAGPDTHADYAICESRHTL